jgi:hypothetical protein
MWRTYLSSFFALGDCHPPDFGVIKCERVTKIQKKSMVETITGEKKKGRSTKGQKTHSPQEPNKKGER